MFNLPLSFDPTASLLALIALIVAVLVYRATSFHRVSLLDIYCSHIITSHATLVFGFVIRNTGLPIHKLRIALRFKKYSPDGRVENWSLIISENQDQVMEHGVISRFERVWKLPITDQVQLYTVEALSCLDRQSRFETHPELVIHSGEFEVAVVPLTSRLDPVKEKWNSFSRWFNSKFDSHGEYSDGTKWIRQGNVLPKIGLSAWWKLRNLGESMRKELSVDTSLNSSLFGVAPKKAV